MSHALFLCVVLQQLDAGPEAIESMPDAGETMHRAPLSPSGPRLLPEPSIEPAPRSTAQLLNKRGQRELNRRVARLSEAERISLLTPEQQAELAQLDAELRQHDRTGPTVLLGLGAGLMAVGVIYPLVMGLGIVVAAVFNLVLFPIGMLVAAFGGEFFFMPLAVINALLGTPVGVWVACAAAFVVGLALLIPGAVQRVNADHARAPFVRRREGLLSIARDLAVDRERSRLPAAAFQFPPLVTF